MAHTASHVMRLDRTGTAEGEQWYCPTCGRRLLLADRSRPQVLHAGDESVSHVGGSLAVWREHQPADPLAAESALGTDVTIDDEPAPFDASDRADELLRPWLKWLDETQPR